MKAHQPKRRTLCKRTLRIFINFRAL